MKNLLLLGLLSLYVALPLHAETISSSPETRLKKAGFELPAPVKPIANYVTWRRSGNTLYLSGHGACEGKSVLGILGKDLDVSEGYEAAQRVGLCALATIKLAVGDLSKVKQVLQINGMVAAPPILLNTQRSSTDFLTYL